MRAQHILSTMFPLLLLCLAVLPGAISTPAYAGGELDGKTFITDDTEKRDELRFADGKFFSVNCDKRGFPWVPYTTTGPGGPLAFAATATSEKHGQMVWTGVLDGDKLIGKYVWTKKGWFRTKTETKEFSAAPLKQ